MAALGDLAGRVVLRSLLLRCGCRRAGRLTNSAIIQTQIQGFELAYFQIYSIYELLECVKGLDLKIQKCRVARTQDNNQEETQ